MSYWAGLHSSPDGENIRVGAASLLQLATGAPVPPSPSAEDHPGGFLCIVDATMDDPAIDQMETGE
jgi:hypothetical protein